jgi:hypothetical protein
MKLVYVLIGSLLLSSAALAQQKPPPDNGAPPPQDRPDGPGPRGERGPGGPGGPGGRMRPGFDGGGPEGGPGMERGADGEDPRMARYNLMRGYLDAVDRYARLAHDPAMSGIAAVVTASDLLKKRGTDAGIDYFTKLLPQVKSPAIGRAIRIQLVDLYRSAGKNDEALNQLKELMLAEPAANEGQTPMMPPPPGAPGTPGGPGR